MNRTIELKSGVNRIGRNQTNDIVLPYSEVSSFHLEILVDKEFIFVRVIHLFKIGFERVISPKCGRKRGNVK